jgi:pilus assembly protein CpaC
MSNDHDPAAGGRPSDRSRCRHGRSLLALATMLVMAAGVMAPAGDAQAQRMIQLSGNKRTAMTTIFVGKSEDVRTDASFVEVTVGDPEIADVNPLTDRSISILGRKIGTTRVSVYAEGKRPIGVFDVEVAYDTSAIAAEMARRFPTAKLKVSSVNGRIMLSGTSPDAVTVDKAVTLARQFGPEVINSVHVLSPQQVMLEVRFIEASRKAGRELGLQWNVFSSKMTANIGSRQAPQNLPINAPSSPTNIPIGEVAAGVLSGASPFGFLIGRMINAGTTVDVLINALEERGLARSLAEPNLVALSGDTASFLAGGEYPIPVSSSFNTITVDYKRYGVGLAFTPTVLSDGLINMKIEPEVSQFDPNHSVGVGNGISVPALIVRRASTTVELRDGQSFVIGGLLQSQGTTDAQQIPWLGDVPILGALFRSASYQRKETDLAIIVTPRLVRPARPVDPIKTPLDNTLPANDVDFFLLGKNEVSRKVGRLADSTRFPDAGHVLEISKGASYVSVKN